MCLTSGVFNAARKCLWIFDQSTFRVLPEQRAEEGASIVDFHVLVNRNLVALVEAKSPRVMHKLDQLLPQNAVKIRWTSGSSNLVSRIFSKVGA